MKFNIPNFLTVFRVLCIPVIAILIILKINQAFTVVAFWLFILSALTDYLDGLTARKLNQMTEFGKVLDPIADKLMTIILLCVLYGSSIGSKFPLAFGIPMMLIVFREILISGLREHVNKTSGILEVSWIAKIKTAFQLAAIGTLIGSLAFPNVFIFLNFGLILIWIAAILTLVSGMDYFSKAKSYFKEL